MTEDAAGLREIISGYPEAVRAMLGINLDYITSMLGFYSMIFSFIILAGAIQAMNLGLAMLTREVRERTADFLLVKPVSRFQIITSKLCASLTMILITNIAFSAISAWIANRVKIAAFDSKLFFMINLTLLFVQLIFLALGMVISLFFKKLKAVLPVSLSIVIGIYMIGALFATDKEDVIRFLSPFRYFDITYIIDNASYEGVYLIIGALIMAVSIISGYLIYIRKDIHA
jgi:ABC-2 type transport system permease protein